MVSVMLLIWPNHRIIQSCSVKEIDTAHFCLDNQTATTTRSSIARFAKTCNFPCLSSQNCTCEPS